MESGLSRYQSAPSSYFRSLVDRKLCEQFVSWPSSPETERIFAQFMTSGSAAEADRKSDQYFAPADGVEKESDINNQWAWKPPLPNKSFNNLGTGSSSSMEMGCNSNSSLVRQSSSPAVLLSQINVESGFQCERSLLDDVKMSEIQYMVAENQGPVLARHSSLPYSKSAAFVESSHSVPCKIRAKRGCATHPRSIAERVRRTRISERIRKLQQLVPNMYKQANTSEMLDLAIEYVKGLQKQVQTLSNNQENCTCSNKQLQQY